MGAGLRLLFSLSLFHLVMVGLGAGQVDLTKLGGFGRILHLYGELTGSGSGYGFFAPGVGFQIRAEFDVTDRDGNTKLSTLFSGANHETDLRTGNIVSAFTRSSDDEKTRRAMVASWAGKVFAQNPGAQKVSVRVESYGPVSVKQYREGKRAEWRPFYRATFVHEPQTQKASE